MSNRADVANVLKRLVARYPRFTITKETIEEYMEFLADVPADVLIDAANECTRRSEFFPSISELLNAVYDITHGASMPSATEAWNDVINAHPDRHVWVEDVNVPPEGGYYGLIVYQFIHPLVEKIARELGWPDDFPGDNMAADRAHFFKAYEAALVQARYDTMRPQSVRDSIAQRIKQALLDNPQK